MASRFVVHPNWGTQFRFPGQIRVKAAAAGLPTRLKVVLAGVTKSAWKSRTLYTPVPGNETKGSPVPAGGRMEPSKSPARKEGSEDPPVIPRVTKVAAVPASMLVRSKAKAWGPRKAVPAELNTFMNMK